MTVAFQRMFGILERWNNNQVTPSLSKPHELSYRSNIITIRKFMILLYTGTVENLQRKWIGILQSQEKNNGGEI